MAYDKSGWKGKSLKNSGTWSDNLHFFYKKNAFLKYKNFSVIKNCSSAVLRNMVGCLKMINHIFPCILETLPQTTRYAIGYNQINFLIYMLGILGISLHNHRQSICNFVSEWFL